ncbi:E3 ubiquitin/ISG15 ligase TRIM25-like [Halichoeres trimaculatus]|uniref:E3 ubiquitin/ISG15 ligase TRIM25-like n=1 Tax=Halichoeres trimaculatus TaxID=147232 RepID=UPI003D9ED127
MEQKGEMDQNQADPEKLSCSICSDQLKEPVTTSCGHSYCRSCIQSHWDREDGKGTYSCPRCQQVFPQKPDPVVSTLGEVADRVAWAAVISTPPHPTCTPPHDHPQTGEDGCCEDGCCAVCCCCCYDGCYEDCGCDDCSCDNCCDDCGCEDCVDCAELLLCCFSCFD